MNKRGHRPNQMPGMHSTLSKRSFWHWEVGGFTLEAMFQTSCKIWGIIDSSDVTSSIASSTTRLMCLALDLITRYLHIFIQFPEYLYGKLTVFSGGSCGCLETSSLCVHASCDRKSSWYRRHSVISETSSLLANEQLLIQLKLQNFNNCPVN